MSFDCLNFPSKVPSGLDMCGLGDYNKSSQVLQRGMFNIPKYPSEGLNFQITTAVFPIAGAGGNAAFHIIFNGPTRVTVNFGDGNSQAYDAHFTTSFGGAYYLSFGNYAVATGPYDQYTYTDGLFITRNITMTFDNPSAVSYINIVNLNIPYQPLTWNLSQFYNLGTLLFVNFTWSTIDIDKLAGLPFLSTLAFTFSNSLSAYWGVIPAAILNKPIVSFSYTGNLSIYPWSVSNMDGLVLMKDTLKSINISANLSETVNGEGVPASWAQLVNLTSLAMPFSFFTTIPATVNQITSLTDLSFAYNPISSWGDLSNLVNLSSLTLISSGSGLPSGSGGTLPTTVPAWLIYTRKFKNLTINGYGRYAASPQTALDTFISNVYAFVIANAGMASTGANDYRNMNFNIGVVTTGDGTAIPSGTLQAPTGYVQGSANGSPASSLERIYVLVHQYIHSWTYRAV